MNVHRVYTSKRLRMVRGVYHLLNGPQGSIHIDSTSVTVTFNGSSLISLYALPWVTNSRSKYSMHGEVL